MSIQKVSVVLLMIFAVLVPGGALAQEKLEEVVLPAPQTDGGKPLMQALGERRSERDFSSEELSAQTLSDLLWAANGINRPDGRRTAPSASNKQAIDIYVAQKKGLYLYDAERNVLRPALSGDLRPLVGKQSFVQEAPVGLIFVADFAKMGRSEEDAVFYTATDTGYISQNVYLYCASEGLSTVVIGWVDKPRLASAMKLRPEQRVILTQPVGYPKKKT